MAGWLEVFSQIVEVDTLLLPAPSSHLLQPLVACPLAWLTSAAERVREGERERRREKRKSSLLIPSRHGMDLWLQQSAAREE